MNQSNNIKSDKIGTTTNNNMDTIVKENSIFHHNHNCDSRHTTCIDNVRIPVNDNDMQIDNEGNNDNDIDSNSFEELNLSRCTPNWVRLPEELLTKIFSYLTFSETEMAERTCVTWNKACNVTSLWKRVEFHFDGMDSVKLVTDAFRLILSKGQFLRELVLTIGSPGLNQAWVMSGCIQQLLEFISQSPCRSIEACEINNLIIFTNNRFFKLSKESILTSLNSFLRSQKNLKHVRFSSCKFNPSEGLKIMKTLKRYRSSIKSLDLQSFFKRRYISATKALKIFATFSCLEEFSVDADYINDNTITWLMENNPRSNRTRRPLRRLKIYFEAFKPPPTSISKERWMAARQISHHMQVCYDIGGVLHHQWMTPFLSEVIPLVECVINWDVLYRRAPLLFYAENLISLINSLALKQSNSLEKFSLTSSVGSFVDLEEALLSLVSSCGKLKDFTIVMNFLSSDVTQSISTMLNCRTYPVTYRFQRTQDQPSRPRRLRRRGN